MSLPTSALVSVNWVPANCIPSPESPAKRTVTPASIRTDFLPFVPPLELPLEFPFDEGAADSVERPIWTHQQAAEKAFLCPRCARKKSGWRGSEIGRAS